MTSLLDRLPQDSRVAVIRLRSLGDCVLTTPALALLKQYRPDLQVAVIVEERFRGVLEGNPDIADLLPPELAAIGRWRPQLTLNFHGGTRSMWLTVASRASIRAGFAHHAYSFLYNAKIPRAQEILGIERPMHTAEHLASAMFWLGVPVGDIPRAKLFSPVAGERPAFAYSVLHPFASAPHKTWATERFLAVARHLRDQLKLEPVILAGPADDGGPFKEFHVYRNASLGQVKSILSQAQLFIGNDSGPAHIAAAFGVPVAVLFGASNPVTWAPWRTEAEVLTGAGGMQSIPVARVIQAAESLQNGLRMRA